MSSQHKECEGNTDLAIERNYGSFSHIKSKRHIHILRVQWSAVVGSKRGRGHPPPSAHNGQNRGKTKPLGAKAIFSSASLESLKTDQSRGSLTSD